MRLLRLSLYKFRALAGSLTAFACLLLVAALCFVALGGALTSGSAAEVRLALVDEDGSALSAHALDLLSRETGLAVTAADAGRAARLLADGQVEGVVTLLPGFGAALAVDSGGTGVVRYEAGSASYASLYIQEIVSGSLLSLQASVTAQQRAAVLLGRPLSPDELLLLEQEMARYRAESTPLYTVSGGQSGPAAGAGGLFSSVFARYYGFACFAALLCVLTLSGGLSGPECRLCDERLRLHRHGNALAAFTDLTALTLPCAAVLAVAAVLHGVTAWGALCLLLYALCIAALSRMLALKTAVPGRIGLAAPVAAFCTSLLGGCFADLSALSPALRTLSLFTPQGLALHALDTGALWPAAVLAAAAALLCVLGTGRRAR